MNRKKSQNISFSYLENGPFLDEAGVQLRQNIYDLWYPEWTAIYKSWGSSNVPSFRDFMLYNLFHCLIVDGQIAGITAHRFFNLEEHLYDNAEYIQSFGSENIEKLKSLGINKVMTFESLLVAPTFRKSQNQFHISKLLFYLANQTFSLSSAHGTVGTARVDVKVPQLGLDIGYEVLEAARKVRAIPCDILLQRNRDIINPQDASWVLSRRLWEERQVHLSARSIINEQIANITKKKAA